MAIGGGAAFLCGRDMEPETQPPDDIVDIVRAGHAIPERLTAETIRQLVCRLRGQEAGRLTSEQRCYYGLSVMNWLGPTRPITPEQQAERERIRQAAQDRDAQVERERAAARERANTLLVEKLTPEQQATWTEQAYVAVAGSQSQRLYRIRGDGTYSMNVDCPEAGYTYCAYPENAYEMPLADVVLAQMLWLTTDEPEFLRMANTSPYRGSDSARYQPGWIDEHCQNADIYINDYINFYDAAWVPPRNDQGQYVVWTRTAERPRRQERPARDGVEAWIPDACVERGCDLTINRTDDPRDLFPCITIDHVDAARAFHLVLPPSRDWDTRGIRRYLQNALHRA